MSLIKKLFPFSFGASNLLSLLIRALIYIVVCGLFGAVIAFLGAVLSIPVFGVLVGLACFIIDLYSLAGLVILVLNYVGIIS